MLAHFLKCSLNLRWVVPSVFQANVEPSDGKLYSSLSWLLSSCTGCHVVLCPVMTVIACAKFISAQWNLAKLVVLWFYCKEKKEGYKRGRDGERRKEGGKGYKTERWESREREIDQQRFSLGRRAWVVVQQREHGDKWDMRQDCTGSSGIP